MAPGTCLQTCLLRYRPSRAVMLLVLTFASAQDLTQVTNLDAAANQQAPRSLRLTFHFEADRVDLVRVERRQKVSPGQALPIPVEGKNSGWWLVLVDASGKALFHRLLDDPFQMRAEHHSPGGPPSAVFRSASSGEFEAIVPDDPAAQSVVLFSSPRSPERTAEPATEVARFRIDTRAN